MSSIDIDDTDLPEYFASNAMKQPPQRTWKNQTDQELFDLFPEKLSDDGLSPYWEAYAKAVIEAFKEKNK